MAERFKRLFQLPANQYIEGSPVILAAGALSKDSETDSIIAQLKFHSVSKKRIKAVKVSLEAFDISGVGLQGVSDYQYLEMDIANGQEFGANKAIVMPNPVTRSFALSSIVVVFNDGTMWESSAPFEALSATRSLTLGNAELEKQYRIATNDQAKHTPFEERGLWCCACGTWNKNSTCSCCRISKEKVFSSLDIASLTECMNARLAKEAEQREVEAARQAQLRAEAEARRKKSKKRLTILSIVALIAAIFLTVGVIVYNKITELTIEKLLSLYTKTEAISLVGEPADAKYNGYDVKFMGEVFNLSFDYDGATLKHFSLLYYYPGRNKVETVEELLDYKITANDRESANQILGQVLSSFTEKYGKPDVFNSKVSTTTYTWIINDRMIELYDYTGNDDLGSLLGAFSIDVNCDHQSFCTHTDTKIEHLGATCTKDGYDRKICNLCSYVEETTIKASGHKSFSTITKEASCVQQGEKVTTCAICGNEKTEVIGVTSHTYKVVTMKDATCTVQGSKKQTCIVCGYSTEEETIAALGHDYGRNTTKAASCESTGLYTFTCSRCKDTYTETIAALGHSFSGTSGTCSRCGYTKGTKLTSSLLQGTWKCSYDDFQDIITFSGNTFTWTEYFSE